MLPVVCGLDGLQQDPWGSPYVLDENEGEGNCKRIDDIRSVGPDGIWGNSDDIIFYIIRSPYCK